MLLIKKRVACLRLSAKDDDELLLFLISYRKVLTFAAELDLFTQNSSLYVYSASSHKNTLILGAIHDIETRKVLKQLTYFFHGIKI